MDPEPSDKSPFTRSSSGSGTQTEQKYQTVVPKSEPHPTAYRPYSELQPEQQQKVMTDLKQIPKGDPYRVVSLREIKTNPQTPVNPDWQNQYLSKSSIAPVITPGGKPESLVVNKGPVMSAPTTTSATTRGDKTHARLAHIGNWDPNDPEAGYAFSRFISNMAQEEVNQGRAPKYGEESKDISAVKNFWKLKQAGVKVESDPKDLTWTNDALRMKGVGDAFWTIPPDFSAGNDPSLKLLENMRGKRVYVDYKTRHKPIETEQDAIDAYLPEMAFYGLLLQDAQTKGVSGPRDFEYMIYLPEYNQFMHIPNEAIAQHQIRLKSQINKLNQMLKVGMKAFYGKI
jgi:hypothetical protein